MEAFLQKTEQREVNPVFLSPLPIPEDNKSLDFW